jgi:steroid delta-isomerase-like uncharacterized protein
MTGTDNAALARRWFDEVWNQRRSETARELIGPDAVCDSEIGALVGPEGFIAQAHTPFLAAFSDLRIDVEGTVSEGDQVVVRWRARGTHDGDGFGIPPTGKRVSFRGMTWIRYRDERMVEGLDSWNQMALVTALQSGERVASVNVE